MEDNEYIVSVVALIISVVALIGAILQLLQQYYASAIGYSSCNERVMGPWASTRRRIFRYSELRFEVRFEAPVLFVCPPSNTRGPVPKQEVKFLKGTEESEADTRTLPLARTEKDRQQAEQKEVEKLGRQARLHTHVHTADNERATWAILLQALQQMEYSSHEWEVETLKQDVTRSGPKAELPESVPGWESHSAVVALQPKLRSWDTMPDAVKKPYATTTICHIVEIAAMLGLHWREFDRSNHKYLAEGNGYLLTGHEVQDLGIGFSFQMYGGNKFEQNRIIPTDEIKLLAFGNVSTIFRPEAGKDGKVPYDNEDPKNTWVLQFGSTTELVESLTHFGCNSKTTNYFRDQQKKHAHLFPVVFEVLGMIAKPMYIEDTYYRYLPNPTTYSWNKKNFSLPKLILEFNRAVNDDDIAPETDHLVQMQKWVYDVAKHLQNKKAWRDDSVFPMTLLRALHEAIAKCDKYLKDEGANLVSLVIREHVQEVMHLLNTKAPSSSSDSGDESTFPARENQTFDELNSAGPEEKQQKFMDIYFTTVAQAVTRNCHEVLRKKNSTKYVHSPSQSRVDLGVAATPDDAATTVRDSVGSELSGSNPNEKADAAEVQVQPRRSSTPQLLVTPGHPREGEGMARLKRMSTTLHEQLTGNVWCTLVFRMLCWLLLHDFHKKDVQISKSELYGSRLPVYIV
ncbi:modin [Diaporthe eres]|uniref:Modin n=1 Tax=Diaporthe vaccinii TaxID=105482 RepID=A0ABR4E440_9PEZI|nr:modin [Diaporthe eres]